MGGVTFPARNTRQASKYTVMTCEDCQEDRNEGEPRCYECGALLTEVTHTEELNDGSEDERTEWNALIDFLGEDFREMIDEQMGLRAPTRTIDASFLSTLGKLQVNKRGTILYDCDIRLGPFHALLVPASFSALTPNTTLTKGLVQGVPEFGESNMLHPELYVDKIIVLTRGKVSFATKAKLAVEAGCAGLIVVQTLDIWPFEMSDSTNELGAPVDIPVFMISKNDAALLQKLYKNDNKNDPHICVRPKVTECSICQENFEEGETLMKLHCRHLYHAECVQSWLKEHNTCPLCRIEMPQAAPNTTRTSTTEGEPDDFIRQPYHV